MLRLVTTQNLKILLPPVTSALRNRPCGKAARGCLDRVPFSMASGGSSGGYGSVERLRLGQGFSGGKTAARDDAGKGIPRSGLAAVSFNHLSAIFAVLEKLPQ